MRKNKRNFPQEKKEKRQTKLKWRNKRERLWLALRCWGTYATLWFETNTRFVQRNNRGTCRVCSSCCRGRRCVCSHEGSVCSDLETRAEGPETPRPGGQQHGASVLKTRVGSVVSYWLKYCTGWSRNFYWQTVHRSSVLKTRGGAVHDASVLTTVHSVEA